MWKVIYENPETKRRDCIYLEDHEHRELMSDISSAKHGEPINFKGYGLLPKSAYKGSIEIGEGKKKEHVSYIGIPGEYRRAIAFKNERGGDDIRYENMTDSEWNEKFNQAK